MSNNFIETKEGLIITGADGKERLFTRDSFTTNYRWRNLIYGYELTDKERKNFDYYDEEELMGQNFFRYKGEVYDLGEFTYIKSDSHLTYFGWQGSLATSAWSAILIKVSSDCEQVMIASYYW